MAEQQTATVDTAGWGRGVRLGSLMIAIAVLAVGFSLLSPNSAVVLWRIDSALPLLVSATLGMTGYMLLPPSPDVRQLLGTPGFLACAMASLLLSGATLGSLALGFVGWATRGTSLIAPTESLYQSLPDWSYLVGLVVAVSWVVLGAVRGWTARPTTSDRLGRAIGWAWILLGPLGLVLRLMMILGQLAG